MGSHCIAPLTSQITPPDAREQLAIVTRSPVRVLLVEDNEEAAALVQFWLADNQSGNHQSGNHQSGDDQSGNDSDQVSVEWAKTVLDAMTRLAQPGIQVVLLDLGLPELSGHRSFRAIESVAGDKIPIIILTADERPLSRDLTLGFGASDYLVKDKISPAQLRQALHNAVLRGRPHHFYRVLDTPSTP